MDNKQQVIGVLKKTLWANISAKDPDSGSCSKNLIVNRDHFSMDDPVKYFCFSGSFERKFLEQSTAY